MEIRSEERELDRVCLRDPDRLRGDGAELRPGRSDDEFAERQFNGIGSVDYAG